MKTYPRLFVQTNHTKQSITGLVKNIWLLCFLWAITGLLKPDETIGKVGIVEEDTCLFYICLTDDANDGWDGGYLFVWVNDDLALSNLTLTEDTGLACFSFILNPGDIVHVEYIAGSDGAENGYFITPVIDSDPIFQTNFGEEPPYWETITQLCGEVEDEGNFCLYSICLYDFTNDGWDDAAISILLNDTYILENITRLPGTEMTCFDFWVQAGTEVVVTYSPGVANSQDNFYIVFDGSNGSGNELHNSLNDGNIPLDTVVLPNPCIDENGPDCNYSGFAYISTFPNPAELNCSITSINLTASGGISYLWDDDSNNPIREVNTPGDYFVTVTDINGCTADAGITISLNNTSPDASITTSPNTTELTCDIIEIELTAEWGGIMYEWNNGVADPYIMASIPGTYAVTVTGSNGCTASQSIEITDGCTLSQNCPSYVTLYVDASVPTSGNGQTWGTAFKTLVEALEIAWQCPNVDSILVASGVYKPTKKPYEMLPNKTGSEINTSDARDATFHIRTGLSVLGGFPNGGGPRDPAIFPTYLAPDIDGVPVYHAVYLDASSYWTPTFDVTTLNGFVITGAEAQSPNIYPINGFDLHQNYGGGVYVNGGNVSIGNNRLNFNQANRGAAIYLYDCNATICNNDVTDNDAIRGAGIYTTGSLNGIVNNQIQRNEANHSGGGIYSHQSTNSLTNNKFTHNKALGVGGAYFTTEGITIAINNTFEVNEALNNGGAAYLESGNHTFTANSLLSNLSDNGAAIYSNADILDCINNVIANNNAAIQGGGLYLVNGFATFANNTLIGNTSALLGSGIYTEDGNHTLNNNIFWNNQTNSNPNTPGADYFNNFAFNTFKHNLLQLTVTDYNPADLGATATGNIFAQNPLFEDINNVIGLDVIHRTNDDGLRLQTGSPALNAGDNSLIPAGITTDIIGANRIRQSTVDLGAYETSPPPCILICSNGGTATYDENDNCSCECPPGYSGANCENYNPCYNLICQNGGVPTADGSGNCGCECPPGYSSANCENYNPCYNHPCQNGGVPTADGSGNCGCVCPPGYSGANCENYNPCYNHPCQNGGVPTADGSGNCGCVCPPGYSGANCENYNPCYNHPCQNGGVPTADGSGNCGCVCPPGYSGANCENYNPCYNHPCQNGGVPLADGSGNCGCVCPPGYSGANCENYNPCYNHPCQNGGVPLADGSGNCGCTCPPGFEGANCETPIPCFSHTCQNGGIPIPEGEECGCQCPTGFIGDNCEIEVCVGVTCQNGGIPLATGENCACQCPPGFTGNNCETPIPCYTHSCQNGGLIVSNPDSTCGCECPPGYEGNNCETISPCTPVVISTSGNTNICTDGEFVTLNAGSGYTAYQWNVMGGNATVQSIVVNTAGLYTVTVTGGNGCTAQGSITITQNCPPFVCPAGTTLYVDQSVGTSGNGTSWATAYKTFDEALFAAHNCPGITTINVAQGTYKPTRKPYQNGQEMMTPDARDITFHLPNNVGIYGGFQMGGSARDVASYPTILSGDILGNDVVTVNGSTLISMTGNTENAYHVLLSVSDTTTTVLDGFTTSGGNANGIGHITVEGEMVSRTGGGGIYLIHSSPHINDCAFENNSANGGGAMRNITSSPLIELCNFNRNEATNGGAIMNEHTADPSLLHCVFVANKAVNHGGAMFNSSSTPNINSCTFNGNEAGYVGGAIRNVSASPNFVFCTFSYNKAKEGGAFQNRQSSPIINNTLFSSNEATEKGGAICNDDSSPQLNNCTFGSNSAGVSGGAFSNDNNSSPTIMNSSFSTNTAQKNGGAISTNQSTLTLNSCIFLENECLSTTSWGGALQSSNSALIINSCTFSGNSAYTSGGSIFCLKSSQQINNSKFINNGTLGSWTGIQTPNISFGGSIRNDVTNAEIKNCIFSDNYTTTQGGAIYHTSENLTLNNCIFKQNYTPEHGGSLYLRSVFKNIIVNNSVFSDNEADLDGSAIFAEGNSSIFTITNCTFSDNKSNSGGAAFKNNYSNATLNNCIFWNNGTEIVSVGTFTANVSNSIVQGGYAGAIDVNPMFVNSANPAGPDGIYRTADDGLRLQAGSPAINTGDNAHIPTGITTDITGAARIQNGIVDMGAYEHYICPSAVVFVDQSIGTSGDGTSWATAFATLDEALYAAHNCPEINTINVAQGTYKPTRKPYQNGLEITTPNDRDFTFHLPNDVAIYGGFPSGGGVRNIVANPTILSGDLNGDDIISGSGSTLSITGNAENVFHVVLSVSDSDATLLNGFTITGGNANGIFAGSITVEGKDIYQHGGGAMQACSSWVILQNCTLSGNSATDGGALYNNFYAYPSLKNSTLSGNAATNHGGAIFNYFSSPDLSQCNLMGNICGNSGGAIFSSELSAPVIINCTLSGNRAQKGGAMFTTSSFFGTVDIPTIITNSAFMQNNAQSEGGALHNNASVLLKINNSTFGNNTAGTYGGAIYNSNAGNTTVGNCTITGNTATTNGGAVYNTSGSLSFYNSILWNNNTQISGTPATVSHSIVQGGYAGATDSNPLFTNPANLAGPDGIHRTADDGITLQSSSPAINSGNNTLISAGITTDITGASRIQYGTVDMGAYETANVCPDLSAVAGMAIITNSTCTDCALSGGNISAPSVNPCLPGSTLHYSTDNGTTWTSTLPVYNQSTPITILTRCICDADPSTYSIMGSVTTIPGVCTPVTAGITGNTLSFSGQTTLTATGGIQYLWNGGNSPNTAINIFTTSGNYTVTVTGSNGCTNSATVNITVNTCIDTLYVDQSIGASGDGLSWATALKTLDEALYLAHNCPDVTTINVAQGIYKPTRKPYLNGQETTTPDARDITFHLPNGVDIYGGFPNGGGTRNTALNPTILSGDLLGNDLISGSGFNLTINGNVENAYHVVLSVEDDEATLLDGFTITGGNADGPLLSAIAVETKTIYRNSGGALYCMWSEIKVNDCTFTGNAAYNGAGLYNNKSSLILSNNTFVQNLGDNEGGGIFNHMSSPELNNLVFIGNLAMNGGGMVNSFFSAPILGNCTFSGNYASNSGGAMYSTTSTPTINNSILWGNGTEIAGTTTVAHSIVQGGFSGAVNVNPMFVNPNNPAGLDGIHSTNDDGLRLQIGSPAVNSGNNALVLAGTLTDITGAVRISDGIVDMGAYEGAFSPVVCGGNVLYVDANVPTGGNGASWVLAFNNLNDALYVAWNCPDVDSILVAAGTYKPNRKPYEMQPDKTGVQISTADARDVTFHIRTALTVLGGYPSGGGVRNAQNNLTRLEPDVDAGVTAYHVVYIDANAYWTPANSVTTLDGFNISGAIADGNEILPLNGFDLHQNFGGGVYVNGGNVHISNNRFNFHQANRGAGIYLHESNANIDNNEITDNDAIRGAGIYSTGCTNSIVNNSFLRNDAGNSGGGIYSQQSSNSLNGNRLATNTALGIGGAYFATGGTTVAVDNTFEVNETQNNGGAIYLQSGNHTFTANTMVNNTANFGAAVYSNADVLNCINNVIANNIANMQGGGLYLVNGISSLVSNTLFDNKAQQEGGGVNAQAGEHQFDNNIFWNNQIGNNPNLPGADYHNNNTAILLFNHSLLQFSIGAYNPFDFGIGNIFGQNPMFVDLANITGPDNTHRTTDDGLRLQAGSPAIDAGNDAYLPAGMTTDITGNPRVSMASVDMGAYEKENTVVCLVFAGIQTNANSNCTATSMEITATGGVSYLWENGSTVNPRTVSASGSYSVTVTSANGCTASENIQVIVSQLPQLVVNINGTSSACVGSNINLQASANMSATYEWSGPNGFSFNGPYFTITIATAAMSGIYTVTATNADGCTQTASRLVTVSATTPTLSGNTQICTGNTISLTAFGGNSYAWSGPGFSAAGSSIVRYNATVAMSGTYTVTVSGAASCTGTASVQVTVHPQPSATLSGTSSVCSGGTMTINAPAGGISYLWSGPNGFTSNTGSSNSLTRTPANTAMAGLYKVTVTNSGGCTATASRSVSVNAPTTASITGATGVCANNTLALTCTTSGVNYQWSGPGGFTFTGAAMTRNPAVAGTYIVTVTNAAGCISTASRNVTINPAPVPSIMNNSNCNRIWLIASGGNSYQWSGPNSYSFTGTTVNRNPATSAMFGTYTVTVTGSGGCTASASITVTCSSGKTIDEEEAVLMSNATLFAYPNPAKGATTITFQTNMAEEVRLSLHDLNGQEVIHIFNGKVDAGITHHVTTDVSHLPAGTYLVMLLRSAGSSLTLRLIVQ